MEVKKKGGEQAGSMVFRFNKKVQQSGLIKESRKRRFTDRPVTKVKRKLSALHKVKRAEHVAKLRKLGKI